MAITTTTVGKITRNQQYYFRDGTVCLLSADKQLFRVHKHFFERESEFFINYFASSTEGDGTEEKPYALDVSSDDLARFLWVWYNPRYTYARQSQDTWLSILTLATRWKFPSVRELAIRQLECLALRPIDKIALYKQHCIDPSLLIPSYVELCRSPLPSAADGARLEMETVLLLAEARERALFKALELGCVTPTSADLEDSKLCEIISDVFKLPSPHPDSKQKGIGNHKQQKCDVIVKDPSENANTRGKGKSK